MEKFKRVLDKFEKVLEKSTKVLEKSKKVVKVNELVEKYMEKSEKVEESLEKSKSWTIRRISRRVPMKVWNAIDKYVEARVLKYIVLNFISSGLLF